MSDPSRTPFFEQGTQPLDHKISGRNRKARFWVLIGSYGLVTILCGIVAFILSVLAFDHTGIDLIFFVIGCIAGAIIMQSTIADFFLISNSTTTAFVTIDQLKSLLGDNKLLSGLLRNEVTDEDGVTRDDDKFVVYGPGTHFSFPWELRMTENNVSLEETSTSFEFNVQGTDGVVEIKGSYRLRADPKRLVPYLLGVASVAGEIQDLIKQSAIQFLSSKGVFDVINDPEGLKDALKKSIFGNAERGGKTDLEKRFGIDITDVAISELLPSGDLQKTLAGIAEARAIQEGTLLLLGMSQATLDRRLADGKISQADVNLARDRFLSVSGNLEGMEIKRQEFDVTVHGLDPETTKALAEAMKVAAAAAGVRNSAGKQKKSTKKGGDA